jgi:hypothetical protein
MSQPPARVRDFAATVAARAQNDPAFARAFVEEDILAELAPGGICTIVLDRGLALPH